MCENCTRREFMGSAAAGGVLLAANPLQASPQAAGRPRAGLPSKVRICVLFTGRPSPADRSWGLCEAEIATAVAHRRDSRWRWAAAVTPAM